MTPLLVMTTNLLLQDLIQCQKAPFGLADAAVTVTLTTPINTATCTVVNDKELIAFNSPAAQHNGINKVVDCKAVL